MEWIYFVVIVLIYGHEPKSLVGAIEYGIPDFAYIEKRRRNQYGGDANNDNRWESINLDDDKQNFLLSNKIRPSTRKKHYSNPYQYGLIDDEPDHSNFQILFYNRILNQTPNRSNFQTLMDRFDQVNQPLNLNPIRIPYRKTFDIYNNYVHEDYDSNSLEENTEENIAELVATNENIVDYNSIQTTEEAEQYWGGEENNEDVENELENNVIYDKQSSKQRSKINSKESVLTINNSHPILEASNSKNQSSKTRVEEESWNNMAEIIGTRMQPLKNVSQNNKYYIKANNIVDTIDSSLVLKGQTNTNLKTRNNITNEIRKLDTSDQENQIGSNKHWIKCHPICKQVRDFSNLSQIELGKLHQTNQESAKVIVNHPLGGRFREYFNSLKQSTNSQKLTKNKSKSLDEKENIVWSNNTEKLLTNESNNEALIIKNTNSVDKNKNKWLQSPKKAMKSQEKESRHSKFQKITHKEIKKTNQQKIKATGVSNVAYMNSTNNKNIGISKGELKNNPRHKLYNFFRGKINRLNNLVPHYRTGSRREKIASNLTDNNNTSKTKIGDSKDAVYYNGSLNNNSEQFLENSTICTYRQDKIESLQSTEVVESENAINLTINKDNESKLIDNGNQMAVNTTFDNNLQMSSKQDSPTNELSCLQTNRTENRETNSANTEKCSNNEPHHTANNETLENLSKSFRDIVESNNSQSSYINSTLKSKRHLKMKREASQQIYPDLGELHSWLNRRDKKYMQKCAKPLVKIKVQVKDFDDALHLKKPKETITNINSEIRSLMHNNKNNESNKDFIENKRFKRRIHWSFKIKNEENTPSKEKVKEIELKVDSKRCKGTSLKETSIEMTLKKEPISSVSQQQNSFKDNFTELEPFPIKIIKYNPKPYMDMGDRSILLDPNNLKQTDGKGNTSFSQQFGGVFKVDKINLSSNSGLQTNKSNNIKEIGILSPPAYYMNKTIDINKMANLSSSAPHINEDYLTIIDKSKSNEDNKINNTSSWAIHKNDFNERNNLNNLTCSLHLQQHNKMNEKTNFSPNQENKLKNNKTNTSSVLHSNEWNEEKEQCKTSCADHSNECKMDSDELSHMFPGIGETQTNESPHLNKWDEWYRWYGCPHLSQILADDVHDNTVLNIGNPEFLPNATSNSPKRKGVPIKTVSNKQIESGNNKWYRNNFGVAKEKGSTILPTLPIIEPVMHSNISLFTGNDTREKEFRLLDNSSSLLLQDVGRLLSFYNDKTCKQSLRNELEPLRNSLREIFKNLGNQEGLSMLNHNTGHIDCCPVSNSPAINTFNLENEHNMIETLLSNLRNFNKNVNSNRIKRHCYVSEEKMTPNLNGLEEWRRSKRNLGSLKQAQAETKSKGSINLERSIPLTQVHSNFRTNTFKNIMKSATIIDHQSKNNFKIETKLNYNEPLERCKREKRVVYSVDLLNNVNDKELDITHNLSDQFETTIPEKQLIKKNKRKKYVNREKIAVVHPIFFSDEVIMMSLTPKPTENNESSTKELEHPDLNDKENETLSKICRNKEGKLKKFSSKKMVSESYQRNSGRPMKIESKKYKIPRQHHTDKSQYVSQVVKDVSVREEMNEELNNLEKQMFGNRLTSERQWIGKDTQLSDNNDKLEEMTHKHHHRTFKSKIGKKDDDGFKTDSSSNIYSHRKKKKKLKSNIMEGHREPVQIGEPIITYDKDMGEKLSALSTNQIRTGTFTIPYTSTEDPNKLKGHLELNTISINLLAKKQQKLRPSKFNKILNTSNNISRNCLIQDIDALLLFHDFPHDKITWHNSAVDSLMNAKLLKLNDNFERLKIPMTSTMAYLNVYRSQKKQGLSEDNQQTFSISPEEEKEPKLNKCKSKQIQDTSMLIQQMEEQPTVNRQSKKSNIQTGLAKNQSFQSNSDSKIYNLTTHLGPEKLINLKNNDNLKVHPQRDLDHGQIQEAMHSLHQSSEIKQTSKNKQRPSLRKGSRKFSISQISKQSQDKADAINEDNMSICFTERNNKNYRRRYEESKDEEEDYTSALEEEIDPQNNAKRLNDDKDREAFDLHKENNDRDQLDVNTQNREEFTDKQMPKLPMNIIGSIGPEDRISKEISKTFKTHIINDWAKNSNTSNREPQKFNRGEFQRIKLQHSPKKNKKKPLIGNVRLKHKNRTNSQKSERDNTRGSWKIKKNKRLNNKYFQNRILDLAKGNKESSEIEENSGYDYDETVEDQKLIKSNSKLNFKANKMGKKKKERALRKLKPGKSKTVTGLEFSKATNELDQSRGENLIDFSIDNEEYGENPFETDEVNSNTNYMNRSNDACLTLIDKDLNSQILDLSLAEKGQTDMMAMQANNKVPELSQLSKDDFEGDEINKLLDSDSETIELDNENSDETENNIHPSLLTKNLLLSKEQNNDWILQEKAKFTPNVMNQEWGKKNDYPALNYGNKDEQIDPNIEKKNEIDNKDDQRINMILEGIANRYKTNSGAQAKINLKSGLNQKLKVFDHKLKNILSPGIKGIAEDDMKSKKKYPKQQKIGPLKQNKMIKKQIIKKNKHPGKRDMPDVSLLSKYNISNVNKPKNNTRFRKHMKEHICMPNSEHSKIESFQK